MKKTLLIVITLFFLVNFAISAEAEVIIPDAFVLKNSERNLELIVNYSGEVVGLQVEMSFAPSQIQLSEPILSNENKHFEINSRIKNGKLIALVFSLEAKPITTDKGPILTIPIKPLQGYEGRIDIEIIKAILADSRGNAIPLSKKVGVIEVTQNTPKTFEVKPNFPNPFNPETVIKYQIPKASQVTVTVYNLKGQEVRILENSYKQPGYYQIR